MWKGGKACEDLMLDWSEMSKCAEVRWIRHYKPKRYASLLDSDHCVTVATDSCTLLASVRSDEVSNDLVVPQMSILRAWHCMRRAETEKR